MKNTFKILSLATILAFGVACSEDDSVSPQSSSSNTADTTSSTNDDNSANSGTNGNSNQSDADNEDQEPAKEILKITDLDGIWLKITGDSTYTRFGNDGFIYELKPTSDVQWEVKSFAYTLENNVITSEGEEFFLNKNGDDFDVIVAGETSKMVYYKPIEAWDGLVELKMGPKSNLMKITVNVNIPQEYYDCATNGKWHYITIEAYKNIVDVNGFPKKETADYKGFAVSKLPFDENGPEIVFEEELNILDKVRGGDVTTIYYSYLDQKTGVGPDDRLPVVGDEDEFVINLEYSSCDT